MIPLYTQRTLGSKPRINDEITLPLWKGIISFLEKMERKNFFAEAYPEGCMDNPADVWSTDPNKLSNELEIYTNLTWPLKSTKEPKEFWEDSQPYVPTKYEIFDALEFLYYKVSTPSNGFYHTFCRHYHLNFTKDQVAKTEYSNEINGFFAATGMIYEFNPMNGHVETIVGEETKQLIYNALSGKMMDSDYHEMLEDACLKITNFRIDVAYQALEKLWDAYERLKCYFDPKNQKEKNISASRIVGLFSDNGLFQKEVEEEMRKITMLGNSLRIRHSETYQLKLTDHRQIHYLFRRCLALIVLIQDQIVASNL
ncbi:AbiJ-NTD4 domain-containing protein [Acinetobacter baumannii]